MFTLMEKVIVDNNTNTKDIKDKLSSLEKEMDNFKSENKKLKEELTVVKEGFATVREEFTMIKKETDTFKEELKDVKEKIATMKERVAIMEKEREKFKEELKDVKEKIAIMEKEREQFKEELKDVKEDIATVKEEVNTVREELYVMNETMAASTFSCHAAIEDEHSISEKKLEELKVNKSFIVSQVREHIRNTCNEEFIDLFNSLQDYQQNHIPNTSVYQAVSSMKEYRNVLAKPKCPNQRLLELAGMDKEIIEMLMKSSAEDEKNKVIPSFLEEYVQEQVADFFSQSNLE